MASFDDAVQAKYGRHYCRKCAGKEVAAPGSDRHSMGIYAGRYCDPCWSEDGRNHDRPFDPMDAGEHYSEDDY